MTHSKATIGYPGSSLLSAVRSLLIRGSRRLGGVIGLCLVLSQLGIIGAAADDKIIEEIRKLPFERRVAGALLYSKSDRVYEDVTVVYNDLKSLPPEKVQETLLERDQTLSVYTVRFGKGQGILGGLVGQGGGQQEIGGIYKLTKGEPDLPNLAAEGWRHIPLPEAGPVDNVWAKTQTTDKPYEWMRVQRQQGGLIFIVEMHWPAGKYPEKNRATQILERFRGFLRNAEMVQLFDTDPFWEWYPGFSRLVQDRRKTYEAARKRGGTHGIAAQELRRSIRCLNDALLNQDPRLSADMRKKMDNGVRLLALQLQEERVRLNGAHDDAIRAIGNIVSELDKQPRDWQDRHPELARWKKHYQDVYDRIPFEFAVVEGDEDSLRWAVQAAENKALSAQTRLYEAQCLLRRGDADCRPKI